MSRSLSEPISFLNNSVLYTAANIVYDTNAVELLIRRIKFEGIVDTVNQFYLHQLYFASYW